MSLEKFLENMEKISSNIYFTSNYGQFGHLNQHGSGSNFFWIFSIYLPTKWIPSLPGPWCFKGPSISSNLKGHTRSFSIICKNFVKRQYIFQEKRSIWAPKPAWARLKLFLNILYLSGNQVHTQFTWPMLF